MNEGDEGNNQQSASGWVFRPGSAPYNAQQSAENTQQAPNLVKSETEVMWTASEYIAQPKDISWFVILGAGSTVLTAVIFIVTRDIISSLSIIVLAAVVGIFAARQPQVLEYALDNSGLHIGSKYYPYLNFKSFSIVIDGAFSHIYLMPLKRFMPPVSIHYAPEDEEKIIKVLGNRLPHVEYKRDAVENFSRKVRF